MNLKTFLFKISDDDRTFCLNCSAPDVDAALHVLLQTLKYEGELVETVNDKTVKTKIEPNPPTWRITWQRTDDDDESAREATTQP